MPKYKFICQHCGKPAFFTDRKPIGKTLLNFIWPLCQHCGEFPALLGTLMHVNLFEEVKEEQPAMIEFPATYPSGYTANYKMESTKYFCPYCGAKSVYYDDNATVCGDYYDPTEKHICASCNETWGLMEHNPYEYEPWLKEIIIKAIKEKS